MDKLVDIVYLVKDKNGVSQPIIELNEIAGYIENLCEKKIPDGFILSRLRSEITDVLVSIAMVPLPEEPPKPEYEQRPQRRPATQPKPDDLDPVDELDQELEAAPRKPTKHQETVYNPPLPEELQKPARNQKQVRSPLPQPKYEDQEDEADDEDLFT
jgi:hypothetical protein